LEFAEIFEFEFDSAVFNDIAESTNFLLAALAFMLGPQRPFAPQFTHSWIGFNYVFKKNKRLLKF
jgi:hypothetical protein